MTRKNITIRSCNTEISKLKYVETKVLSKRRKKNFLYTIHVLNYLLLFFCHSPCASNACSYVNPPYLPARYNIAPPNNALNL